MTKELTEQVERAFRNSLGHDGRPNINAAATAAIEAHKAHLSASAYVIVKRESAEVFCAVGGEPCPNTCALEGRCVLKGDTAMLSVLPDKEG